MNNHFLLWEKYNCDNGNPTVLAKVKWFPPDIKNRACWPRGTEFSLPVKFEILNQNEAWSLVLKVLESANHDNREVIVQIKFLIDDAPHHVLLSGNKFLFFDKSAEGVVITSDEM